ncbi:Conserved oligomeric Golgi complex subunit 3 [Cryptosporidium felis]|nr:Conserved oligomeric Golgi complex subunit 3 [Cryptosporidium felis]
MNGNDSREEDPGSSNMKSSFTANSSINLIPKEELDILRNISESCNKLTFISGIVIPEKQEFLEISTRINNKTLCEFSGLIRDNFIEEELNKLELLKSGFTKIKNEWDTIRNNNINHKKNLDNLESIKVRFIGKTNDLHNVCDNSLSILGNLESQAKLIEEYIFPYQQYTIMYHKLQNEKISGQFKEISNYFEIIDNSILFFQNHTEIRNTENYIEGYKKLRVKLCNMIKNTMKNILNEKNDYVDSNSNLKASSNRDNKSEYNISLFYTQLKAKGKIFSEYLKLLLQRLNETHPNDVYRSTIYDIENYYINFRISDSYCGIKSFGRLSELKNPQNCPTIMIQNLTRMALSYCKYEWNTYNSFFCYDYFQNGGNEAKFLRSRRFIREYERKNTDDINLGGKSVNFCSLVELFGKEYYKITTNLLDLHKHPEMLRESIQCLSQDITKMSIDVYDSVSLPDAYLSVFLHFVLKLQNKLIEQLLICTEVTIKEKIEDYPLKIDDLNYPGLLTNNPDKKTNIHKFPEQVSLWKNGNKDDLKEMLDSNSSKGICESSAIPLEELKFSSDYCLESETLTNISFPPNSVILKTNSDVDDSLNEDEYFGSKREMEDTKIINETVTDYGKVKQGSRTVNISTETHPVVRNSLLVLSYIDLLVPISTYGFLCKLIVQKCCNKLLSAREYIANKLYSDDKLSRMYHGNLFLIRNLSYLKFELIKLSKQQCLKSKLELIGNQTYKLPICESNEVTDRSQITIENDEFNPYFKYTIGSISTIVDVLLNSCIEDLINNICSNISLPLTKIILQIHPEIQSTDIDKLKCTNNDFIRDSIGLFFKNLDLHINSYILKYFELYLSITNGAEMKALLASLLEDEPLYENQSSTDLESKMNENCSAGIFGKCKTSLGNNFMGGDCERTNVNKAISSVIPSSLSVFVSIKEVLMGVINEFDHVLNKRLEIEKNLVENELGWKFRSILDKMNSVQEKLSNI